NQEEWLLDIHKKAPKHLREFLSEICISVETQSIFLKRRHKKHRRKQLKADEIWVEVEADIESVIASMCMNIQRNKQFTSAVKNLERKGVIEIRRESGRGIISLSLTQKCDEFTGRQIELLNAFIESSNNWLKKPKREVKNN